MVSQSPGLSVTGSSHRDPKREGGRGDRLLADGLRDPRGRVRSPPSCDLVTPDLDSRLRGPGVPPLRRRGPSRTVVSRVSLEGRLGSGLIGRFNIRRKGDLTSDPPSCLRAERKDEGQVSPGSQPDQGLVSWCKSFLSPVCVGGRGVKSLGVQGLVVGPESPSDMGRPQTVA